MADLTTIILTYNEEKNIKRSIDSVKNIAERVIVVDSGSTDRTKEIAYECGAEVVEHLPWINYATQFNWALNNTNIQSKWILRLDADEQISDELAKEIEIALLQHDKDDVNGFELKCKIIFMGRWIRHGGTYPLIIPRIFRRGYGYVEMRKMDEHTLIEGKTICLKNDLIHYDFKGLDEWIDKHNKYSVRECQDAIEKNNQHENQMKGNLIGNQRQRKRFLKNGIYYNLPKFWRAKFYYIYRYYLRLGFLDGIEGKIFCFLQAYWYRFLVDAKLYEFETKNNKKE
ncbi:glycosyltransferase family 2 protein [Thomasclavelia spiroformis]|uniref:glycosyltransferase family 2 protein n=1 Tax=Thomasclavelia spiroformis TaxID=29348 RepID=UPI00255BC359|nr:glycosyltransferase family 2 protein [Thomasclavelia spiroformis]